MSGDNKLTFHLPTHMPELTLNLIRTSRGHSTPSLKISCTSVQPFSHNLADKETKKSIENNTPSPYRGRGNNSPPHHTEAIVIVLTTRPAHTHTHTHSHGGSLEAASAYNTGRWAPTVHRLTGLIPTWVISQSRPTCIWFMMMPSRAVLCSTDRQ